MVVGDEMVEAACRSWHSEKWWELARPDELRAARSGMGRALEAALAVSGWEQEWQVQAADDRWHKLLAAFVPQVKHPDRLRHRLVGPWVRPQDEPECDHVWRSSFGDTFCEKCNQDAPTGVRCRTCKGSGAWCDEGWVKPPQPCRACSGSGLVPIQGRKQDVTGVSSVPVGETLRADSSAVPVQQDEPCDECGCIDLCDPRCSQADPDPLVPVQQDEPKGEHKVVFQQRGDAFHEQRAVCICGWSTPWQENVDHGSDQQVAARRHRENPVPVQQDELQMTPNDSKDLESGPVQQDEPEGVYDSVDSLRSDPPSYDAEQTQMIRDTVENRQPLDADPVPVQQDAGCQSRSPITGAQCNWDHPYERTLHKHRSDDGETWREPVPVRQDEPARHPSVRFPPTTPLLQDGWCDGSGRLPDPSEHWPKNTRKCPSCDGRGCAVPVQQEPERCDHDWIVETRTASIKVCQSCGMEQAKNMDDAVVGLCAAVPSVGLNNDGQDGELLKDSVSGVSSVPSVGLRDRPCAFCVDAGMVLAGCPECAKGQKLRDRIACELANLEYERSGRLCETEDFYADADRVLSVLHEAGTQEDEL